MQRRWTGAAAGVAATFGDIEALAARCRFGDCAHETEPGCAVLAAVERGELGVDRLDHFRHLGREMAFEARASREIPHQRTLRKSE